MMDRNKQCRLCFSILFIITFQFFIFNSAFAQQTPYELKGKNYTATYQECIDFYKDLDEQYQTVSMIEMGMTDAGLPLHVVLLNKDAAFNPDKWHQGNQVVILINNGIHPGEPDGIDASMMLVRDLAAKELIPENVSLAFIPVYNIGGCLNRSEFNRVDQNGPDAFGSRGNSQNLDLNRDFIKCDSKEARSFAEIFHWLNPDIFIDNHVSDGADYPNVMTLATTQYQKLGGVMGAYLNEVFEPALFQSMKEKGTPMIPYVNAWGHDAREGWAQFFDSPRYATGYAALFHTFGFTPETHMLKPYADRVKATFQLMETIFNFADLHATAIISLRRQSHNDAMKQQVFPVHWKLNEKEFTTIDFNGYTYKTKKSTVSGLPVKFYDRTDPYKAAIPFKNQYMPVAQITAPAAYLIPQGWWKVIELLKLNEVIMEKLSHDTAIVVEAYKIKDLKSAERAYEGHHGNSSIKVEKVKLTYAFRKGDYIVPVQQLQKRFLIEVLEPEATDAYLAWNFFDAILLQKEGYSDYAYETYAAQYLSEHPELQAELNRKRNVDTAFAANAAAQLDFVFKSSPYYEKGHNLYPVFRL
ncbi:MAG: M14 family metallopeptidase, partial [Chitinophagaceae bacterium]|nr:M14 family metallopeptidase [Chitinophagaceae bacterium]